MSKTKMLLDVVDSLRSLTDSIQAVIKVMETNESTRTVPQEPPSVESKPTMKAVSLEQVRATLAEKSQAGFTAEVRGLLEKYGAPKLSQIDPTNFQALLADAEELK